MKRSKRQKNKSWRNIFIVALFLITIGLIIMPVGPSQPQINFSIKFYISGDSIDDDPSTENYTATLHGNFTLALLDEQNNTIQQTKASFSLFSGETEIAYVRETVEWRLEDNLQDAHTIDDWHASYLLALKVLDSKNQTIETHILKTGIITGYNIYEQSIVCQVRLAYLLDTSVNQTYFLVGIFSLNTSNPSIAQAPYVSIITQAVPVTSIIHEAHNNTQPEYQLSEEQPPPAFQLPKILTNGELQTALTDNSFQLIGLLLVIPLWIYLFWDIFHENKKKRRR